MPTTLVNHDNFAQVFSRLQRAERLTVDDETNGLNPYRGDSLCGVAVLAEGEEAYYFPFRHSGGENLELSKLEALNVLLSNPNVEYEGHNYGFDLKFNKKDGVQFPARIWDTQVAAHVLNENERSFKLKSLGVKYVGADANAEEQKLSDQLALWGYGKAEMWRLPPRVVAPYAGQDVILTRQLSNLQRAKAVSRGMLDVVQSVQEFALLVVEIEDRGLGILPGLCAEKLREAEAQALAIQARVNERTGHPVKLSSPKQAGAWLGVGSTALKELEPYLNGPRKQDVQDLLDYRAWTKAANTYYKVFLRDRDDEDRVHCRLRVHGTISGRLSCSDPNLQAIPRTTEIYRVKDVLGEQDEDWLFVEADYSQAEMRVASHYGRERRMAKLLTEGADLHSVTAQALGIPRDAAKRINFGVIYGIGAQALSQQLGISEGKAKEYLTKYHQHYPGFKWLYKKAELAAKRKKEIQLFTGRRRHFNVETAFTHKASSNLIQGSVGEMVRLAMLRVKNQLPESEVQQLLQVHDSILFRVRRNRPDLVREVVRLMEDQEWCGVPHKVDVKIGPTWGTAKEFEK